MKLEGHGVQISLGAPSIFMTFVVLCMMTLPVLSHTRSLQNEKIAQREKLYQGTVAKSDAGAQLLTDELRRYPKQTLQQSLEQSEARSLLREYMMKTDWEQDKLFATIPVQDTQQLQLRLQKQGSAVHIKTLGTITKGDAL